MAKIVYVCGSPGAGKTSIINGIADNKDYKIVNVGSLMLDLAIKKGYLKSRDELRFMDREKFAELQIAAFKDITKMAET